MAKQQAQSGLLGKLGPAGKQAFDEHKNDETNFGAGGDLPAGIEGGIAQLIDCRFAQYQKGDQKGEYFFIAAGTVVEPKVFTDPNGNKLRVEGYRTQIGPEPMCDTPSKSRKTVADHIAWVLNEFRKLGVDTRSLSVSDFEATAAALKEAGPFFTFRTWKGEATKEYPNPQTFHQWRGATAYDGEPVDDVQTTTETAGDDNGGGGYAEEATASDDGDDVDLTALGQEADGGDGTAQAKLKELAAAVGVNSDEIDTWAEVAALTLAAQSGEGSSDAEADGADEGAKKVGEVYYYNPNKKDAKSKRVEVEIVAINGDKGDFKNLNNPKTIYKDKPLAELHDSIGPNDSV